MTCSRCDECRNNGESFCLYCGEILNKDRKSGCQGCEESRQRGDKFCMYCGTKLIEDTKTGCPRCEESRLKGDKFCIYCGTELTEETSAGCPRCEESRQRGDKFCMYCGTKLTEDLRTGCPKCEECLNYGYDYCLYCGRRLNTVHTPQKRESPFLKIGFAVGVVSAFLIMLLILFEYSVAIWGFPTVFTNLENATVGIIIIIPQVYTVCQISGPTLQAYYVFIFAMVTISLFVFIYKAVNPVRRLMKNGNDTEPIKNTAFFEVAVLFCALYFVEVIFALILNAFGQDVGSLPERETWQWMFSLIEASVWEEIISRVLYLGIPMLIIALIFRKKEHPWWRYLVGGFGLSRTALIFILFSSIMFGAGHLTNWTVWKFFPTFLGGLIMGYLFAKYGIYASIMFHFLTDYIQAEMWLTGSDSIVMTALLLFMLMIACAPYVGVYVYRMYRYLSDMFGSSKQ